MTTTCLAQSHPGGFTRVPNRFLRAPVSASAKFLLIVFCSAANDAGESWYSYQQLGALLNRSKAAVAGYVRELREAGYVTSDRQTTRAGFNYRLKIRVVGWREFTEHWRTPAGKTGASRDLRAETDLADARPAAPTEPGVEPAEEPSSVAAEATAESRPGGQLAERCVQPVERRIQPAERNKPRLKKTNTHTTQTPDASASEGQEWTSQDEQAWTRLRSDRDPYGQFDGDPDPALLQRVIAHSDGLAQAAGLLRDAEALATATGAVQRLCREKKLRATQKEIDAAASTLAKHARTRTAIHEAIDALAAPWQPHWHRLPADAHLERAAQLAMCRQKARLETAYRFASRAVMARSWLTRRAAADRPGLSRAA